MSAQEQQTIASNLPPDAGVGPSGISTASSATEPESAPARSNSRSYTLFEEARQDTWTKLQQVDADSESEALDKLGEKKLAEPNKRFMAIPTRYVRPRKPKVDTVTTITYD